MTPEESQAMFDALQPKREDKIAALRAEADRLAAEPDSFPDAPVAQPAAVTGVTITPDPFAVSGVPEPAPADKPKANKFKAPVE